MGAIWHSAAALIELTGERVRYIVAIWLVGVALCLPSTSTAAAPSAFAIRMLDPSAGDPSPAIVVNGSLDDQFAALDAHELRRHDAPFWLQLRTLQAFKPNAVSTLTIHKTRQLQVSVFAAHANAGAPLRYIADVAGFRGMHDLLLLLPDGLNAGDTLYARVNPQGVGTVALRFGASLLDQELAKAAEHARMIAIAFGALMAMATAALLIWFVLADKLLALYAVLFSMQALYVAFLSGQAFDWPLLSRALPFAAFTWNVTAALSGAVACLFVREIADLKRFSPRVYVGFGWLSISFLVLTVANLAQFIGMGSVVAAIGNVVFIGAALSTLIIAFLAWRRQSRAAGWFLIAWGLLEAFTIATSVSLLVTEVEDAAGLLYYGLPLSMVAASILVALGVADRLREQRLALTDAEKRAQTDPLTGVLNRRSLLERLEAACFRARARGLPIALLFIDLDHFKEINDSHGHLAGDACLRGIIGPIQSELRQSDVIGRYGGEEFVVILSSADAAAAEPIAERIRKRVAEVEIAGFTRPLRLTCSIGVATSDQLGVWGEHLIAHADEAVYVAKRSGRNRVQFAAALAA
jgi:diguanylate cyclase (GGDEF)-like protein